MSYLYLPFALQVVLMTFDEYLHHKRGLGLWERIGHPLDTMTVLIPVSFIAFKSYSDEALSVYLALSTFSCLFITKDEFIHGEVCGKLESWIHSLLFILHPLIFLCAGLIWKSDPYNPFLKSLPALTGLFLIYQIMRWSILWKPQVK